MDLPYEDKYFDYIIFGDVLEHLYDPQKLLIRIKKYLADSGKILCSIPNIMHASVLLPLLKGEFRYQDSGILDRTHIRFFTLYSAIDLLKGAGYKVNEFYETYFSESYKEEFPELYKQVCDLTGSEDMVKAYQYLFIAEKEQ
jgi:2-polyprenyl-3-methyl-5-hydroxy-6-metoxy-1,4-benzoquinol methylase